MDTIRFPKGSEWRKWDLHIHTASSEENSAYKGTDSDSLLVKAWREHGFAAVAITDHFLIDIQRIRTLRQLAPEITIFPGVELRTDKGTTNIHPILIFSEDTDLDILDAAFKTFKNEKAEAKDNIEAIHWNFQDIYEFTQRHHGLISIHAGKKSNGIEEIPNDTPLNMAVKAGYAKYVDIFEIGNHSDIARYNEKIFPNIEEEQRKPLIICSDNHDPREYHVREYLWIKANPTFEGLKQILLHRDDRVFIGSMPHKLEAQDKNKSRYIKSVSTKKNLKASYPTQHWFEFSIDMNPGLVAIIGNKGSGKSALSDIIGHLCMSKTMNDASFLNERRFRHHKGNLSKDYTGSIEWFDGKNLERGLDIIDYKTNIEDAQYLPQQFIEKVCNDLGSSFQDEIDSVIFSYIDKAEKSNAINLAELKLNISRAAQIEIAELKADLDKSIENLIQYEMCATLQYKKDLENNLTKRREDLERHNKNKPQEIKAPKNTQSDNYKKELAELETQQVNLEKAIGDERENLKIVNERITDLELVEQKVKKVVREIETLNSTLKETSTTHNIKQEELLFKYSSPLGRIQEQLSTYAKAREEIQKKIAPSANEQDKSLSLVIQLDAIKSKKDKLISSADATEKSYQAYIVRKKEWEEIANKILGTKNDENSIQYYIKRLEYINVKLEPEYKTEKSNYINTIKKIFEKNKDIIKKLSALYEPVKNELDSVLGDINEKIEFDIEISLSENSKIFSDRILNYINQKFTGMFQNKSQGTANMLSLVEGTDFNNKDSLISFITHIYNEINENIDDSNKKAKENKKGLYSTLGELEYLNINFILKLGGRSLQELSPGERGIVLLVFYLALNKGDKPLIIDQPEDNLDNQSVYNKLVKCIKNAKSKRQVIIVTHNPNIAVACDAEQIIYCEMDKKERRISYVSGAIEDNIIKKYVVDVLEGTMPAFVLRKFKYEN